MTFDQDVPSNLDPFGHIEANSSSLTDEELRLECVKAVCLSHSGSHFPSHSPDIVDQARKLFTYIRGESDGEVHSDS